MPTIRVRHDRHLAILAWLFLMSFSPAAAGPHQASAEQKAGGQEAGKKKPAVASPAPKVGTDSKPADTQEQTPPGEVKPPAAPAERRSLKGTIQDYSADFTVLRLATSDAPEKVDSIKITDQALKDALKTWRPADKVIADVSVEKKDGAEVLTLLNLTPQVAAIGGWEPAIVLFVVLFVFALITLWVSQDLKGLLFLGEDGKYSNSKTQMTLWFSLVVVTYVSAFVLRWIHAGFIGNIGIPTNVLALTGLSGLTFAGAKAITTQKAAKAAGVKQGFTASFPGDLVRSDDGKFDFGDYQMIIITVIAVTTYLIIGYNFLVNLQERAAVQLPDVDSTVLAVFGVGQGAYLTKKATTDIKH